MSIEKQFPPEKVRELVKEICGNHPNSFEKIITKWLEQNQPSPMVVGLSDSQLRNLHAENYKNHISDTDFLVRYKMWSKNQTFAQSSEAFKAAMVEAEIRNEEIAELKFEHDEALKVIGSHTKTIIGLEKERDELQNKCELLELEFEAFKPKWNDAPDDAFSTRIIQNFYYKTGVPIDGAGKILHELKRPKPTQPVVEIGQVWNGNSKVEIVGIDTVVRYKHENHVCCIEEGIEDFIAKFERVS